MLKPNKKKKAIVFIIEFTRKSEIYIKTIIEKLKMCRCVTGPRLLSEKKRIKENRIETTQFLNNL